MLKLSTIKSGLRLRTFQHPNSFVKGRYFLQNAKTGICFQANCQCHTHSSSCVSGITTTSTNSQPSHPSHFYTIPRLKSYNTKIIVRWSSSNRKGVNYTNRLKGRTKKKKNLSSIVQPVEVKLFENPDDINVGAELSDPLKKGNIFTLALCLCFM